MLVAKFSLAALSRTDIAEAERRYVYLYVDKFPAFTTTTFAGRFSEMRKYRLNLVLAHQYIAQVDETVRDAILGNAGTIIAFVLG